MNEQISTVKMKSVYQSFEQWEMSVSKLGGISTCSPVLRYALIIDTNLTCWEDVTRNNLIVINLRQPTKCTVVPGKLIYNQNTMCTVPKY